MYLHLIKSDPKFPRLIRKYFETAEPGVHVYVLLGGDIREPIESEGFLHAEDVSELARIVQSQAHWDGIFINGILEACDPFLPALPPGVKVAWVVWGYEIYGHLYPYSRGLYEPLTRVFCAKSPWVRLKALVGGAVWRFRSSARRAQKVLSRVDYVVCHIREEYDLIKRKGFLGHGQQWFDAPVVMLSDLIDFGSDVALVEGKNILVGNSASPSNNHVDVFMRLAEHDLSGRKVIVPLSYGSAPYREFVLEQGARILGDAFEPILDFLPLEAYLEKIGSCRVVILNHYRQQAVGNLIAALWSGASVYLGPSTLFACYKRQGLPVYSFQGEFDLSEPPMDVARIEETRAKITSILGDEASCAKLKKLLGLLRN